MRTYLERRMGYRYFNIEDGDKITFTKFAVGYLSNFDNEQVAGNLYLLPKDTFKAEFTGEDISRDLISERRLVLKMFVPPEYEYFKLNCVVLYAKFSGDSEDAPFFISYSEVDNPKFSIQSNKFGTKYYYMLQANIPNLDVFDLSNLATEALELTTFGSETDLQRVVHTEQTQFILDSHQLLTAENKVLVIESEGQHFGLPVRPITLGEKHEIIIPTRSE